MKQGKLCGKCLKNWNESREGKKMKKKVKNIVKCNQCGKIIKIDPRYEQAGELEYRYFICKYCSAIYVISVTDEALRQAMKHYQEVMEQVKMQMVPPEISQEAQLILQNNVQRSRELKEKYPLKQKL